MVADVLGFIFTSKCNFKCRHCCNDSGPQGVASLSIDEISAHIEAAHSVGTYREIGISGGEPFLFPAELLHIVRVAKSHGMSSSVTTNGFWARSHAKAMARLEPLVHEGLSSINISVSPYHLEFADPTHLRLAAEASIESGLETRVNVVYTSRYGVAQARELFGPLCDQLTFVAMPLIPAGRAAEAASQDIPQSQHLVLGNCESYFAKTAVTAEGDVYPCCSPGGFTPPLLLGNLRAEPLTSVVKKMSSSTLLSVLEHVGPGFFVPFIDAALDRDLMSEGYVDQCHLCHAIMSEQDTRQVVADAVLELERELTELGLTADELDREPLRANG